MLAFDREVRVGHHVYPDMPIDDLIEALANRARPLGVVSAHAELRAIEYPRGLKADDHPIAPSDIAAAINDLFDRHGPMPMTADMGDCLFTAMEIENTALAAPGYYAGMGFGVPAGIGVAAATGRRPLILVGDGAFQMTGWELGNCRRYGLDPIVVLFNNTSWEMLRVFQLESRFNDLDNWHFAALAPSLGGHGERVRTRRQLQDALECAVARRGQFSLVEVMLPRGVTSRTLAQFVSGFKAARAHQHAMMTLESRLDILGYSSWERDPCPLRRCLPRLSPAQGYTFAAMAAFALGAVQLAAPKGTLPHRTIGWLWVALMVTVTTTSFWIHDNRARGEWSPTPSAFDLHADHAAARGDPCHASSCRESSQGHDGAVHRCPAHRGNYSPSGPAASCMRSYSAIEWGARRGSPGSRDPHRNQAPREHREASSGAATRT